MLHRVFTVSLALAAVATAADWTQWRGPERDGRAASFEAPAEWPANLTQGWSITVGVGHASPIVAGETIYQFSREGDMEVLRAVRLQDGKSLWRAAYPAPYSVNSAAASHGAGPKATPTLVDSRIYTFGISGILSCFNAATGAVEWRRSFESDYAQTSPLYGSSVSPAVADGRVFVHVGGHDDGALLALDAASGETVWSWEEDGPGYASPLVAELSGVRQVITQTQQFVLGVDFSTGETLWKIPFSTPYDQNTISPVLLDDLLIYSGTRTSTVAVKISKTGGGWQTEEVWTNREIRMYMSTPVLADGLLFGLTERDKGVLFCADARTGKVLWESPPRQGDNAALLLSGDLLLALTTEAELTVARAAGDAFTVMKNYEVAQSNVWAHPALAGPYILVKDRTKLTRWSVQ